MSHKVDDAVVTTAPSTKDLNTNKMVNDSSATAISTSSGNISDDNDMKIAVEKGQFPSTSDLSIEIDSEKMMIMAPAIETADPNVVDWDGPDDPERPMNWPFQRKSGIIVVLSVFRLLMCVTIS